MDELLSVDQFCFPWTILSTPWDNFSFPRSKQLYQSVCEPLTMLIYTSANLCYLITQHFSVKRNFCNSVTVHFSHILLFTEWCWLFFSQNDRNSFSSPLMYYALACWRQTTDPNVIFHLNVIGWLQQVWVYNMNRGWLSILM